MPTNSPRSNAVIVTRSRLLHFTTLLLVSCQLMVGGAAVAEDADERKIEELEERIEELEASGSGASSLLTAWSDRIRLSGSGRTGYYEGQSGSPMHDRGFQIWDVRFFVDAELGGPIDIADHTIVRNVGFTFEWSLVRIGRLTNEVGEMYVDVQGIADSPWLNFQFGRFQLPVGEGYLLFSRGTPNNPFITNAVAAPWYWDEGIKFYGASEGNLFSYVASITAGETSFNTDLSDEQQFTLKLMTDPTPWLHISVSGLYSGSVGSASNAGTGGSLWLGESWARAFGANFGSPTPQNYVDGIAVANGPNVIDNSWFAGADVILNWPDQLRMWLAYGRWSIDQGSSTYDRRFHSWIAELVLYGGLIMPELADVFVGGRVSGLGTYDTGKGYLLDFRSGSTFGYNMETLTQYSVVLGWAPLDELTLRVEYTHVNLDLVRGVSAALRDLADESDSVAIELGVQF